MSLLEFNLDDNLAIKIVEYFDCVFKYIHPNIITIIGIILNYFIYNFLFNNLYNNKIFYILIFFRWLVDCLDGAIARKYNKTSKIGHYLDTYSDIIIQFIFFYYFINKIFNLPLKIILIIFLILLYIINKYTSFLTTHELVKNKQKSKNILFKISGFLVNNSYIIYLFAIILYNIINKNIKLI